MNPLSIQSLQQLSLEALQEVEKNYPYFLLPKMFRLKQYHLSNHAEFEPCLHKTAIYSYNRKALFNFIHPQSEASSLTAVIHPSTTEKSATLPESTASPIDAHSKIAEPIEPDNLQHESIENSDSSPAPNEKIRVVESSTPIESAMIEPEIEESSIAESDLSKAIDPEFTTDETALNKENIEYNTVENNTHESLLEENHAEPEELPIQAPQVNIKEIEATVYENLKDILEQENQRKTAQPSAEEVLEAASENSFLQWLRIVEKDKITVNKKDAPQQILKSPLTRLNIEPTEKEQKIKVKKDPELDALEGFVKDQIKRKKKKSPHVIEIPFEQTIEKSTQPQEIYTEALAKLLTKQGKYEKAIDMYEKLILKYPEKSSFFAVQIKLIKDLNS